MANMIDYIKWRGDLTFKQSPANELDNILLVFLVFLDMKGIVPSRAEEGFVTMRHAIHECLAKDKNGKAHYGAIIPNKDIRETARLMAESERFANAKLTAYVNEINSDTEEQFSAFTAVLDDGTIFVSFKGTDDTLVGWKEDFNMSFSDVVPGQLRATEYINNIASTLGGKMIIGGHSKGGNFAVYAAATCARRYQRRILTVYNNDGPGFSDAFLRSDGYENIKKKIVKFVPQESVVGMLLGNDDNYTVVQSGGSGVLQHNSYLWEVMGASFIRREELSRKSIELNRIINEWIGDKDIETRREIAEAFYEMLRAGNAETLTDLEKDKTILWKTLVKVDAEKRGIVFKAFVELMGNLIVKGMPAVLKPQNDGKPSLNEIKEEQK